MGNLLNSVKSSDVIESIDARRETSVEAEDLVVDEGGKGKVVKQVGEVLPDVGISVLAETLVVEAVDLGDLTRLVVAAKDGDALGISDLQGDKQGHCLNRVVATVNVVAWFSISSRDRQTVTDQKILTHEQVVGVWIRTTNFEELHQVVELTVDITTHSDGAFLQREVSMKTRLSKSEACIRTTGWTFDSSWRTSRACRSIESAWGFSRQLARDQEAQRQEVDEGGLWEAMTPARVVSRELSLQIII